MYVLYRLSPKQFLNSTTSFLDMVFQLSIPYHCVGEEMSEDSLTVRLSYYDNRSRLIDKKVREEAKLALRMMPSGQYCEFRISTRKNLDIFVTNNAVVLNEQEVCTFKSISLWFSNYKCIMQVEGNDEIILQIKDFVRSLSGESNNKENIKSENVISVENNSPEQKAVKGKRGFGIVSKDLFRSGYTPDTKTRPGKPLNSHSPSGIGSSGKKKQNGKTNVAMSAAPVRQSVFMGLLTAAAGAAGAVGTGAVGAGAALVSSRDKTGQLMAGGTSTATITYELTDVQNQVVMACLNGRNVFYTGGAGTGKSTLLTTLISRLVQAYGERSVFVAATTGLAACAVGGTTVHQFAGISTRLDENLSAAEQRLQYDRVVSQV